MKEDIISRATAEARYLIDTGATVREAAKAFDVSKSTLHKDVTERLKLISPKLHSEVRTVLDFNLSERHLRGGNATKLKYEKCK